jgi:hypothetical protein
MHALTAVEIIRAWEWGQDKHPLDRGLLLLALAQPELSREQLAALSIGQRNARLLSLRVLTLGPQLQGSARCPGCATALGFTFDAAALQQPEPAGLVYALQTEGFDLTFRLPNSLDLVAVAGCDAVNAARTLLIERCLLNAQFDGQPIAPAELPETALAALAEAVAECDPQAEVRFKLSCADCGHAWSAVFDIVAFLWAELSTLAQRLLLDTATLARSYGWSEAEILTMSAARRQFYLQVGG